MASRIGLRVASQASREFNPRSTSLLCTSARFTVLLTAVLRSSGVNLSAPDSPFSTASSAEASKTILFTLGCPAALRDQLVNQRGTRPYMLADKPLRPLDPAFQGSDAQFVIFHSQNDFVAGIDAQRFAKLRGNHNTAIFIHAQAGFSVHCQESNNVA